MMRINAQVLGNGTAEAEAVSLDDPRSIKIFSTI
jgi:hypothetical protein